MAVARRSRSPRAAPPLLVAVVVVVAAVALIGAASAFAPASSPPRTRTSLAAVKFDKAAGRWRTDDPSEADGAAYGPVGSLYRAGPVPFLSRLRDPDAYDQAVLKYMAQDGCDRKEAQGNMGENCAHHVMTSTRLFGGPW